MNKDETSYVSFFSGFRFMDNMDTGDTRESQLRKSVTEEKSIKERDEDIVGQTFTPYNNNNNID